MRHGRGLTALALLFSSATIGTCVYPTERDASVYVNVTPIHILLRGSEAVASATAWQRVAPGDTQLIPNVKFVWSSSNPLIASVNNAGRIVGVKSGTVIVTAAAANFDKAARAGADTVRVAAALEIDSVRPKTIKYGEMLKVYGVGVDSILEAKLASAVLFPVPFSDVDYGNGTALTQYWVPPPAVTDSLFFLGIFGGNGVFGFVHDTTKVLERDLYDPNDTIPRRLSLSGPAPFPQLPFVLFYNPALAFEHLPRGATVGADWFRFGQATPGRDLTFIVESPELAGTFSTFLSDSLGWNGTKKSYIIGHDSWTFGPSSHACHGLGFRPSEATADSTIVAFKSLGLDSLDAIAIYTQPGRYGLSVIDRYVSELPADAHEDDNSCNAADLRGTDTLPFRDTLAIENPHDIDWIRFKVPNPAPLLGVQIRVSAFPSATGATPDSLKALDLYVIKVPAPSDAALSVVLADTAVAARTEHNQTLLGLTAGADYYAVVLDFAGATTYYEICVAAAGTACATAFPAPPRAAAVAGSRSPSAPARPHGARQPLRGRLPRVAPRLNLARPE